VIPAERAHLFVAALSHKGMKEGKNNEDRYAISSYLFGEDDPTPILFAIISDGIGGHLAGEVAAEMVVDYVSQAVAESNAQNPLESIKEAVEGASQAVRTFSEKDEKKQGMGATCVCAWVIGDRLYTGAVGDSRLYLMRGAVIQQLTTDHTWIQEALDKGILTPEQARDHPNAHVIRQYVGGKNLPEVDFRLRLHSNSDEEGETKRRNQGLQLEANDTILLCSDGLTDLVWNDEILEIVRSSKNLEAAAKKLIDTANQRGGHDNITVILLSVPQSGKDLKKIGKMPVAWIIGGMIAILFALSMIIGFVWYITQPPTTPTPTATLTSIPMPLAETSIPNTETMPPPSTPTPHPTTIGATYTPWPTNAPELTSTPTTTSN